MSRSTLTRSPTLNMEWMLATGNASAMCPVTNVTQCQLVNECIKPLSLHKILILGKFIQAGVNKMIVYLLLRGNYYGSMCHTGLYKSRKYTSHMVITRRQL